MPNSLTTFKSTLAGGGARPNLFEVAIDTWPGETAEARQDLRILCKGAQLPESTVGLIEVPFRGRTFKVSGDRTFASWTITVINDTDFAIRESMEEWMRVIAQYQDGSGATNPTSYMRNATVSQLDRRSSNRGIATRGGGLFAIKEYTFRDIFPTNISAIDLSYDSSDTIEEYTVEFQVNFWEPRPGFRPGVSADIQIDATVTL